MRRWMRTTGLACVLCVAAGLCINLAVRADDGPAPAAADPDANPPLDAIDESAAALVPPKPAGAIRFATFNASLNRPTDGELARDLAGGENEQARKIAQIIQIVHPDVILINEFDRVSMDSRRNSPRASLLMLHEYLLQPQTGHEPIAIPMLVDPPVNTGRIASVDLNNDGKISLPEDALGFGRFPGQYGLLMLSRFPVAFAKQRTFRNLRWLAMPDHLMPTDYYSPAAQEVLRLSSKTHADVPVIVDGRIIHVLISHPTPPAFDGPEDRNGRRNHDEIRFWADYVSGDPDRCQYIIDDEGQRGGLTARDYFVILGDLNADPHDGASRPGTMQQLFDSPRVSESFAKIIPQSLGAIEAAAKQAGANAAQTGPASHDTADFSDAPPGNKASGGPGNLRVDYVIPSRGLTILQAGVFWPTSDNPLHKLIDASDHRLVWVDVKFE